LARVSPRSFRRKYHSPPRSPILGFGGSPIAKKAKSPQLPKGLSAVKGRLGGKLRDPPKTSYTASPNHPQGVKPPFGGGNSLYHIYSPGRGNPP